MSRDGMRRQPHSVPGFSATVRRSAAPIAALIAFALVLAGCGSSSASPPTATPVPVTATPVPATSTPIVITATPKPAKPTAKPVRRVTVIKVVVTATPKPTPTPTFPKGTRYTPQPTTGKVTPLPGATPVKPAPGLILGEITHPLTTVHTVQTQANSGNKAYLFYLHPTNVIKKTLPQYGFRPPIDIASPARPVKSYSGRPVQKADVLYKGTLYEVYVAQPATRGAKGVWFIVTILRQHLILGGIVHAPRAIAKLQRLADSGKKNYAFYLNPTQAILKGLPQYGFKPPTFTIVRAPYTIRSTTGRPEEQAQLTFLGDLYYVDVSQLAKTGPKGIWLIVGIFRT